MKCPKCKSENIEPFLVIPETKEGTIIGRCRECGTDVKQGKSVFG